MIEVKDLKFQYREGNFRLNIPEFKVNEREKVAIIGPSGSGKTTLLNLLSGILLPNEGTIQIGQDKIQSLSDNQRREFRIRNIGFVFQSFELLNYLNVLDNIIHPYRISRALKLSKETKDRAALLANEMGVSDKLKRNVERLSQGEKQRVAICRAMLNNPKLILADEATGNLDPANKLKILDKLFQSSENNGATLIAVTHDVELTSNFDRVIDFKDWLKE